MTVSGVNINILAGFLSNTCFLCVLFGYILRNKLVLLRLFFIMGSILLVTWGATCFDIVQSYPLICWNGIFFVINTFRFYDMIKVQKGDKLLFILNELKGLPDDIINFLTLGNHDTVDSLYKSFFAFSSGTENGAKEIIKTASDPLSASNHSDRSFTAIVETLKSVYDPLSVSNHSDRGEKLNVVVEVP